MATTRAGVEVGPVLGFIGLENHFFVLAPYFPHSDGPYVEILEGARAIELTWKWAPMATTPGANVHDAHQQAPGFLAEWGRVMQQTYTNGGSMSLEVPVPGNFILTSKEPRDQRAPEDKWCLIDFRTNASPAPLDPVACPRPRKNMGEHKDTAPSAKRAHATLPQSYNGSNLRFRCTRIVSTPPRDSGKVYLHRVCLFVRDRNTRSCWKIKQ